MITATLTLDDHYKVTPIRLEILPSEFAKTIRDASQLKPSNVSTQEFTVRSAHSKRPISQFNFPPRPSYQVAEMFKNSRGKAQLRRKNRRSRLVFPLSRPAGVFRPRLGISLHNPAPKH